MADQSKSEKPTQRRVKKARDEGQFAQAKEIVSALQFIAFLGLLSYGSASWLGQFRMAMRAILALAFVRELSPEALIRVSHQFVWHQFLPLGAGGLAVVAFTLGVRLLTTGFGFSLQRLAPDMARLNPLTRLKQLPTQNLASVVEAALMLPVFLWAAYVVVRDRLDAFLALPLMPVENSGRVIGQSLMSLFWKAAAVFLVFGAVDLMRQMQRYRKDLSMSRQELKEEVKEMEGNPQMKARIRRLRRDRSRRQMMKEVPKATAVIVNPTHYAVAIRYQVDGMAAPMAVAKGKNYLARRIREIAIAHQVPIIENPPLAQALYGSVEVGQEIPAHLYRAVAEVLAYIYKLMHGKLPG